MRSVNMQRGVDLGRVCAGKYLEFALQGPLQINGEYVLIERYLLWNHAFGLAERLI
jgi:hypothetical protein